MTWIWLILSYLIMEIALSLVFQFVIHKLHTPEEYRSELKWRSLLKGILERLFLVTGLMYGYPHVIIAFGALKIGTRFTLDNKVSNDYFLIGNFISLLASLIFVILINRFLY